MCGSRGAFLGLAGMGIFIFFNSLLIKKIRWKVTIVCVIGVIGLVSLMSEEYKERLFSTTKSDEEQTAAEMSAGRTDVWKVGLEMSKDYPLGAGGGSFLYMSPSYMPENLLEESVGARASHSTYILTLVEQGYLGLFLYCAFLFFSIKMLHDSKKKLIRISKETDATEITNEHLITYCIGLQASIISLVITSAFADRLYYEMLYLICAMAACLSNICENHIVENHNNHAIVET